MTDKNIQKIDSNELRRRAEERIREETATEQPLGTEEDPLKLLHELQVHQVELEMQNAELRQTRDKLEAALEQCTDLYDFAPVGYFTLDREGTISRVNFTAASLLGLERSRLVGRRFERFVGVEPTHIRRLPLHGICEPCQGDLRGAPFERGESFALRTDRGNCRRISTGMPHCIV